MTRKFVEQTQPHAMRAMEPETIQKNGASPKSLMSRGNFLNLFLISCLLATSMCFMTGCDKDEPDNPSDTVPDPEGTINYTLVNNSNTLALGTASHIELTGSLNLKMANGLICTTGKVNSLGNVIKIPTEDAWTTEIGAILNHGYIVKLPDNTYARLFIYDWQEREYYWEYGKRTVWSIDYYLTIKYQYPFEP
jgi:hypothetical protein